MYIEAVIIPGSSNTLYGDPLGLGMSRSGSSKTLYDGFLTVGGAETGIFEGAPAPLEPAEGKANGTGTSGTELGTAGLTNAAPLAAVESAGAAGELFSA